MLLLHTMADGQTHLLSFLDDCESACPVCGYNLHRLTQPKCPECGAALELRVGSTDLRIWPWLVSLLAVGLPGGLFINATVILSIDAFLIGNRLGRSWLLPLMAIGAVLHGTTLIVLITKRRKFWACRPVGQRRLTSALVIGGLGVGVLLIVLTFIL